MNKFNQQNLRNIVEELSLSNHFKQQSCETSLMNQLMQNNLYEQALHFLALGLPRREAAWWGHLLALQNEKEINDLQIQKALQICEQWIREPSEELRYQAKSIAEVLDLSTSSSWVAMAIFWSGGNIAAINKPLVEPGEFMCGHAVFNAIAMAISRYKGNSIDIAKSYLQQGLHIMLGGNGKIFSF